MKMPQFRDWLTRGSSRKLGRQGGQLPEMLFWTSLQPSVIFRSSQRHLSSYPPSKILAKGPAPSADSACSPKAGWTQVRELSLLICKLETTDLPLGATVRMEKVRSAVRPAWRTFLAATPRLTPRYGLHNTGQGMQSVKLYQMEKTFLQSFKHFIWCVFANSPNPEMLSAVFSSQREVL